MATIDELRARLALPPLSQVGVAVHSVDKAVEFYSGLVGIGPFHVYDATISPYWHREEQEPSVFRIRQGKAMMGAVELELMQPLEGKSAITEWLEENGEGLHHLGFLVRDFDAYAARFAALGFKPLLRVESFSQAYNGLFKAACYDTTHVGGVIIEIFYKSWLLEGTQ